MTKQQRSKKNGRFLPVYNWDKKIPEICALYANGKAIYAILKQDGMPDSECFFRKLRENPEYQAQWDDAGFSKAAMIDSDYDDIAKLAKKAVKDGNANALRPWLDARVKQRGQLNPKYRDREVKHVHEIGPSARQILTDARNRRDGLLPKPDIIEGEFSET